MKGDLTMSNLTDGKVLKNLVGGEWVEACSGLTEPVPNPATEQILAYVPI